MPYYYHNADVTDMTVRQINKLFRANDDSGLWPVRGRYNVTERAIRRVRRDILPHMDAAGGIEYAETLSNAISEIVNNPRNW